MSGVLIAFTAVILVALFAQVSIEDPGYVLISRVPHEIEISLALFFLIILFLCLIVYFVVRIIVRVVHAPRDIKRWRWRKNSHLAQQATMDGYAHLIQGSWKDAERTLTRRISYSNTPLLDCLGAAYAAQQQGNTEARDYYLGHAHILDPNHAEAVELTRARLLEQSGNRSGAREVLEQLQQRGKTSGAAQAMLISLLRLQQDWRVLEKILPQLKRSSLLPPKELEEAWHDVQCHKLSEDIDNDGRHANSVWASLSRRDRKKIPVIVAYCNRLITTGNDIDAERILRKNISHSWNDELIRLYGLVRTDTPGEQISIVEGWTKNRENNATLLTCLARLYLYAGNRNKARSLLVEAASHGGGRESYMELGLLLEAAGEDDKALQCYRRGLQALKDPIISTEHLSGGLLPLVSDQSSSNSSIRSLDDQTD
ncbi:MAG: hypothetical protein CL398_02345 [Acidiferrobacteraceae bacterium]|nr:hypothetical protein [Acidiferrobacteraceae bacterium]|tara:strand:+ start:606 stop:1886 length:1281 start_codon:yes stop_codon:yes gene_type:complete